MKVSLHTITPNAEQTIVEIARVSSSRTDKKEDPAGLINYLIRNKHWSPFEHGHITFEIETSKAIAIQFLRHVSCRFQEFSQRYAEVEKIEDIQFRLQAETNRQSSTDIIGDIWQNPEGGFDDDMQFDFTGARPKNSDVFYTISEYENLFADIRQHLEQSLKLYKDGLKMGIAKECMRMILPMATQTKLYMTGSIRSWIHIIDIRVDGHAQKEAQLIAKAMRNLFVENLPIISEALGYEYER